jgi:hypothetical protein
MSSAAVHTATPTKYPAKAFRPFPTIVLCARLAPSSPALASYHPLLVNHHYALAYGSCVRCGAKNGHGLQGSICVLTEGRIKILSLF